MEETSPVHQKKDLTTQMSSLKKQNLKASDYSKRSIDQLFPKAVIENCIVKEVNESRSIIAVNEGNGNFKIKELPYQVQLSCVCGIVCTDLNKDGLDDLIMGGNNFEFKPQFSQLDANYGNVLINTGNLQFDWQNYSKSGFFIRDEVKHLATFKDAAGKKYLVAAINNNKPRIYALDK